MDDKRRRKRTETVMLSLAISWLSDRRKGMRYYHCIHLLTPMILIRVVPTLIECDCDGRSKLFTHFNTSTQDRSLAGGFNGDHDDFYSDPHIISWYKAWAAHLIHRNNTYNGILYREDPTIFAWELANEPRCQGSGTYGTSTNCTLNYAIYGKDPVAFKITSWIQEVSSPDD